MWITSLRYGCCRRIREKVTGFNDREFTEKHKFEVHTALFNETRAYVIKDVDVLVIDVKNGTRKDVKSVIVTVHQKIDRYNHKAAIPKIMDFFASGNFTSYMQELDDDFFEVSFAVTIDL